jgi:hypothetical protein
MCGTVLLIDCDTQTASTWTPFGVFHQCFQAPANYPPKGVVVSSASHTGMPSNSS